MPHRSRIDAPGALHHIIAREIKQSGVFLGGAGIGYQPDSFGFEVRNITAGRKHGCEPMGAIG